jgi:hypothetical protein
VRDHKLNLNGLRETPALTHQHIIKCTSPLADFLIADIIEGNGTVNVIYNPDWSHRYFFIYALLPIWIFAISDSRDICSRCSIKLSRIVIVEDNSTEYYWNFAFISQSSNLIETLQIEANICVITENHALES